jgi:uncharacterized protein YutE (UPF0331/DUF86 family)
MTSSLAFRERLVLERLRETYEREGYEFFLQPSGGILPPFLRGVRPDAIALKPGEGVVIEVKFGNRPGKDQHLGPIAAALHGHADWRLKAYFEQPRPEDALSIGVPTQTEIDKEITESVRLATEGHERAAFLLAWSVLEAIARVRAFGTGLAAQRPISAAGTVESLEMAGLIDKETGRDLRTKAQLRNLVAHGDLGAEVDHTAVEDLIRLVRDLSSDAETVPGE